MLYLRKLISYKLKAVVVKKAVLDNIPSASGIEIVNGIIYIIGDDSPYLYCLDHNLRLLEKVELFSSIDFEEGRIPKTKKADLECMTSLRINNNDYLLILGSGSGENRNNGYLVKCPTKYNKKYIVQEINFKDLNNFLALNPEIVGNGPLNLEAAACDESHFLLFNRGTKTGTNVVLDFNYEEWIVFLTENSELIPFPKIIPIELPKLNHIPSGLSGATVFDNILFFTASVEDTNNAIEDGAIIGSYVGYSTMPHADSFLKGNNDNAPFKVEGIAIVEEKGNNYLGKIESLSIYLKEGEDLFVALAVTDDDKGGSELVMIEIYLLSNKI